MKSEEIKIYSIGCYGGTCAIRVKDVPTLEEARKMIKAYRYKWQSKYTDEEYIAKFGHEKVVIVSEEQSYIRYIGRWVEYGYEYKEYDFIQSYEKSKNGGRGAMLCWVFEIEERIGDFFKQREEEENV